MSGLGHTRRASLDDVQAYLLEIERQQHQQELSVLQAQMASPSSGAGNRFMQGYTQCDVQRDSLPSNSVRGVPLAQGMQAMKKEFKDLGRRTIDGRQQASKICWICGLQGIRNVQKTQGITEDEAFDVLYENGFSAYYNNSCDHTRISHRTLSQKDFCATKVFRARKAQRDKRLKDTVSRGLSLDRVDFMDLSEGCIYGPIQFRIARRKAADIIESHGQRTNIAKGRCKQIEQLLLDTLMMLPENLFQFVFGCIEGDMLAYVNQEKTQMITTLIYAKMQLRIEEESANYFVARLTLAYELVISKTQKEGDEPKFVEAHLTDHHAVNVISQLRTTTVVAKLKAVLVSSNKLEIGEEEEVPQSLSQVYEPSQYPFPASLSDMSLNLSEDELEGVENRLLYDKEQDEPCLVRDMFSFPIRRDVRCASTHSDDEGSISGSLQRASSRGRLSWPNESMVEEKDRRCKHKKNSRMRRTNSDKSGCRSMRSRVEVTNLHRTQSHSIINSLGMVA